MSLEGIDTPGIFTELSSLVEHGQRIPRDEQAEFRFPPVLIGPRIQGRPSAVFDCQIPVSQVMDQRQIKSIHIELGIPPILDVENIKGFQEIFEKIIFPGYTQFITPPGEIQVHASVCR